MCCLSTAFLFTWEMWRTLRDLSLGACPFLPTFLSHLIKLNISSSRMTTVITPLVILWLYHRLQMSNTFYESVGQNWFTLDSVHIHYNWTHEATFNATEVYAPATYSYHCQHVSSLQKYDTLLVPSSHTDSSANWHITFTDFQVGALKLLDVKIKALVYYFLKLKIFSLKKKKALQFSKLNWK